MQSLIPAIAPTFSVAVTTAPSQAVQLTNKQSTLRIVNEGPNNAYIAIGASQGATVAATPSADVPAAPVTNCTPVLAGSDIALSIPTDQQYWISAITKTGTATLDITQTEGN